MRRVRNSDIFFIFIKKNLFQEVQRTAGESE